MPHKHRDTAAGIFHVFTHCVWATPFLYRDRIDRLEFLRHLARTSVKSGWSCLAYCLMESHYHLIVEVGDGILPSAMQSLNLGYAIHHNRRHGMRGHVQFRRYGSRRLHDDGELLTAFSYVVRNPVEAGLCASAQDWAWSSYRGTIGLAELPAFVECAPLFDCFPGSRIDPRLALRARVESV
jgi:REP element-mobilizing transposase RayT